METKICSRCGKTQEMNKFRNQRNQCKECEKELITKWRNENKKHTEELTKCSLDYLVKYLLQTFKDNYGYEWDGKEQVHIDHIIPLATANTEQDIVKLCHYTNLQLLKAKDNLKNGV